MQTNKSEGESFQKDIDSEWQQEPDWFYFSGSFTGC